MSVAQNKMPPIHPGEILAEDLEELGLSARAFAEAIAVPSNRVSAILNGSRAITADTALRLAAYFGTSAKFWLNLQLAYDLKVTEAERGDDIRKNVKQHAA